MGSRRAYFVLHTSCIDNKDAKTIVNVVADIEKSVPSKTGQTKENSKNQNKKLTQTPSDGVEHVAVVAHQDIDEGKVNITFTQWNQIWPT